MNPEDLSRNLLQLVHPTAMPGPAAHAVVVGIRFAGIGMSHHTCTIVEAALVLVQTCVYCVYQ